MTFMQELSFRQLRIANVNRSVVFKQNELEDEWSLTDWGCALSGEVGEACNIIKKIRRGDFNKSDVNVKILLGDELADIQIYLDLLANAAGIDLEEAVRRKFNAVSVKRGSKERL